MPRYGTMKRVSRAPHRGNMDFASPRLSRALDISSESRTPSVPILAATIIAGLSETYTRCFGRLRRIRWQKLETSYEVSGSHFPTNAVRFLGMGHSGRNSLATVPGDPAASYGVNRARGRVVASSSVCAHAKEDLDPALCVILEVRSMVLKTRRTHESGYTWTGIMCKWVICMRSCD
ncbi:hypothetical protein BC835DRAFT_922170 [Cytidiella melzeri]|nr:hypothetical protein BC835DRAFT_922170 [Cytidiella melzeri]